MFAQRRRPVHDARNRHMGRGRPAVGKDGIGRDGRDSQRGQLRRLASARTAEGGGGGAHEAQRRAATTGHTGWATTAWPRSHSDSLRRHALGTLGAAKKAAKRLEEILPPTRNRRAGLGRRWTKSTATPHHHPTHTHGSASANTRAARSASRRFSCLLPHREKADNGVGGIAGLLFTHWPPPPRTAAQAAGASRTHINRSAGADPTAGAS